MKKIIIPLLNQYLEQDVERASGLDQVDNKVVHIVVSEINLDLVMKIHDRNFIEIEADVNPDVEINISLKVIPDYLMGVDQDKLIKNGAIEIKGDTHIASVMQKTLREIEIDWEEIVSKYTGDAVAYHIGKGAKSLHVFGKRLRDNLRQDMRDYLQDNIQVSATQDEVDVFIEQVDATRAQVDRLEARLNRLQSRD